MNTLKYSDLKFKVQKNYQISAKQLQKCFEDLQGIKKSLASAQRKTLEKDIEVAELISLKLGTSKIFRSSREGDESKVSYPDFNPVKKGFIYVPISYIHTHALTGVIPSVYDLENCYYRGFRKLEQDNRIIWFWDSPIHIIIDKEGNCFFYQQPLNLERSKAWETITNHREKEHDLRKRLISLKRKNHQKFYEKLADSMEQQGYNAMYSSIDKINKNKFARKFSYFGALILAN